MYILLYFHPPPPISNPTSPPFPHAGLLKALTAFFLFFSVFKSQINKSITTTYDYCKDPKASHYMPTSSQALHGTHVTQSQTLHNDHSAAVTREVSPTLEQQGTTNKHSFLIFIFLCELPVSRPANTRLPALKRQVSTRQICEAVWPRGKVLGW